MRTAREADLSNSPSSTDPMFFSPINEISAPEPKINISSSGWKMGWTDTDPNTEYFHLEYSNDLENWTSFGLPMPKTQVNLQLGFAEVEYPAYWRLYASEDLALSLPAMVAYVSSPPQGQVYVPPAPAAPSGVSASPYVQYQGPYAGYVFMGATVSWTDNSENESHFLIQRRSGSGSWETVMGVDDNVTSAIAYGGSPNVYYFYRVVAVAENGEWSEPSNEAGMIYNSYWSWSDT